MYVRLCTDLWWVRGGNEGFLQSNTKLSAGRSANYREKSAFLGNETADSTRKQRENGTEGWVTVRKPAKNAVFIH